MSDKIQKKGGNPLPAMPSMFGNLAPVVLPEMDYSKGLIPNFFQKRRLKQAAEASKYRAEVAEYQEREVAANANRLMTALTFGEKFKDQMDEIDHGKNMRKLEEYEKQEIVRGIVLKNEEQTLKNDILRKEAKDLDFSLKLKYKDTGYDYENEDRE
jgi:hypothetical protein